MAKYPYIVNKNGIWYQAGQEVPNTNTSKNIETTKAVENPQPFSKTDINRMPVSELRILALNTGVENAEEMTGAELKEYLINVFGL